MWNERININSEAYRESCDIYETIHDVETFNRVASNIYQLAPDFPTNPAYILIHSRLIRRHEDRELPRRRAWQCRLIWIALVCTSIFVSAHQSHYGPATLEGKRGGRERKRDCRENVIWIRSYDESNRNSAERTRHRLEIRFAGGDGRGGWRRGKGDKRGHEDERTFGPKAHRSFMGHLLGIPVKPISFLRPLPSFSLPLTAHQQPPLCLLTSFSCPPEWIGIRRI